MSRCSCCDPGAEANLARRREAAAYARKCLASDEQAATVDDVGEAARLLVQAIGSFAGPAFDMIELLHSEIDVTDDEIEAARERLALHHQAADAIVGWLEGDRGDGLEVRQAHTRALVSGLLDIELLRSATSVADTR